MLLYNTESDRTHNTRHLISEAPYTQGGLENSRSLPASPPFRGKLRIGKLSSKNLHIMGMLYIYTLLQYGHIKAAFNCTKCTALGMAEIDYMLTAADVHGCY